MKLYVVMVLNEDDEWELITGGGSSSKPRIHVYTNIGLAKRYRTLLQKRPWVKGKVVILEFTPTDTASVLQ